MLKDAAPAMRLTATFLHSRPERFPGRGLKERSTCLARDSDIALSEPKGASLMAGVKPRSARQEKRLRLNGMAAVIS
jgi:hypothetical protein